MKPDIETVYNDFSIQLERYITRRVSDHHAAEDILQDVFLKIFNQIDTLQDESKLQAWIYRITRNAIIDYYRRQKEPVELPESLSYFDETAVEIEPFQELLPSIGEMLGCLPKKYRQALVLTEYRGLTQQEAARRLGLSLSGAKSRVQRARQQMKEMLLNCCHFEFDRLGKVIDYQPNLSCCTSNQLSRNCAVLA